MNLRKRKPRLLLRTRGLEDRFPRYGGDHSDNRASEQVWANRRAVAQKKLKAKLAAILVDHLVGLRCAYELARRGETASLQSYYGLAHSIDKDHDDDLGLCAMADNERFERLTAEKKNAESEPDQWKQKVTAITEKDILDLAEWRGYGVERVRAIVAAGLIGKHNGAWAFPVRDDQGRFVGVHELISRQNKAWIYDPKGIGAWPLIHGTLVDASIAFVLESSWDWLAFLLLTGAIDNPAYPVVCTRGAMNVAKLKKIWNPAINVIAIPQNDEAGQKWLGDIRKLGVQTLRVVKVPDPIHDLNDWLKSDLTREKLREAIEHATFIGKERSHSFEARAERAEEEADRETYQPKGDSPVGYVIKGLRPNDVLIGDGFLERGGAILLAGPSGIGKSSIAMQVGCYWACGQSAFDLVAVTPLRIVMVQHEDSHNDLVRMSALVDASAILDRKLIAENFWIETLRGKIGRDAIQVMYDLVRWHRADLLILNPLTAFHDGNISENKDNVKFLYGEVGRLLDELRIGLLAFHHKGKPPKNGKKDDADVYHEVMYEILGGSILTNFFRGIITVSPIPNSEIYKFVVAKRFEQSGWPFKTQYFKWDEDHSKRLWIPATIGEAETAKATNHKSLEDLRKLVPATDTIAREILDNRAAEANFVRREYRALLEQALSDSTPDSLRLYQWSIYNPEGRARVAYSRFEQPANETASAIREAKKVAQKAKKNNL